MRKLKKTQADNYNHQAEWQKLYINTKMWISDLLFYKHDLQFIQLTLNRYFLSESNIENVELTTEKEINLIHIHTYCNTLIEQANLHLEDLSDLIKDPFKFKYRQFKRESKYLKADIANFVKILRRVRKDIFEITESVLKNKDLFFLVDSENKPLELQKS